MKDLQQRATKVVLRSGRGLYRIVRSAPRRSRLGQQRPLFISLKRHPSAACHLAAGHPPPAAEAPRHRRLRVFMFPRRRNPAGGRQSSSSYQFTLLDPDLVRLAQARAARCRQGTDPAELTDVTTDREQNGLQAKCRHDRTAASRLMSHQDIDNALKTPSRSGRFPPSTRSAISIA